MTSRDVIQLAMARLTPGESLEEFQLVMRTPGGGARVVGMEECPLYLQRESTQLELQRKKRMEVCHLDSGGNVCY